MRATRAVLAVSLLLLCLPVLAGDCQNPIRAWSALGEQTGAPVRLMWSLGAVVPQSQTLTGHDFEEPIVLGPNQTTYTYIPELPGEKHAKLTVVTDCGTFSRDITYFVQQCNVVAPPITLDKTSVVPGEIVTASIELPPGHRVRWIVVGGTPSSSTSESIQITAGGPGTLRISALVARGDENSNSCEVRVNRFVTVASPCGINVPQINPNLTPPIPNAPFTLYIGRLGAGETVTFNAENATITQTGVSDGGVPYVQLITPETGSFSVDVIVSKSGCSRTFSRAYEVTPCAPTATVAAAPGGSCDTGTIVVDFTGDAPFQGYWNDGEYFHTYQTHLERTVTVSGTYTIRSFIDKRCGGTVTGEAVVGAGLPAPQFMIDDTANGYWYGNVTCPGLVRTARLTIPLPTGTEVVWSVENGTIVAGQGTETLQFSGNDPGPTPITAVFRNTSGCMSQPYTYPYVLTQGVPAQTVTVEPATIGVGGTAVVRVTFLNDYQGGTNVTSSLGDFISPIGSPDSRTIEYKYQSTNGGGVATITATATNYCGDSNTATTTLTIDPNIVVPATATVRAIGGSCADYAVYAEFTGRPPFSGTWSTGETFTSDWNAAYLYPPTGGTYTITEFRDANGAGTVTGEATFDFVGLPPADFTFSTSSVCPNGTVTATVTTPIPDGATANWTVWGGTILSGQGTSSIEIQAGDSWTQATVQFVAPGACGRQAPWQSLNISSYTQQPSFYVNPMEAGTQTEFWVWLDPKTATWNMENSMGDAMEVVGNPYPHTYAVRYTSTHGTGESTIRIYGTTSCGASFEATQALQILPPRPTVTLTSTPDPLCGANVTATFTGTPPFSGTWNDGQTFTTNSYTVTRNFNWSQYVWLDSFTDGTGQSNGSPFVLADATLPPYAQFQSMGSQVCVSKTVTASVTPPPAGYEIYWYAEGPQARIVSGQGTPQAVIEGVEAGQVVIGAVLRTATGCTGAGSGFVLDVQACPID